MKAALAPTQCITYFNFGFLKVHPQKRKILFFFLRSTYLSFEKSQVGINSTGSTILNYGKCFNIPWPLLSLSELLASVQMTDVSAEDVGFMGSRIGVWTLCQFPLLIGPLIQGKLFHLCALQSTYFKTRMIAGSSS